MSNFNFSPKEPRLQLNQGFVEDYRILDKGLCTKCGDLFDKPLKIEALSKPHACTDLHKLEKCPICNMVMPLRVYSKTSGNDITSNHKCSRPF